MGYVSSTITGDENVASTGDLTTEEAWAQAANAVGANVSIVEIQSVEGERRVDAVPGRPPRRHPGGTRGRVRDADPGCTRCVRDRRGERAGRRADVVPAGRRRGHGGDPVPTEHSRPGGGQPEVERVSEANPQTGLQEFPWNYPSTDIARGSGAGSRPPGASSCPRRASATTTPSGTRTHGEHADVHDDRQQRQLVRVVVRLGRAGPDGLPADERDA